MRISEALLQHKNYHVSNSRPSTIRSYEHFHRTITDMFADRELSDITPDDIMKYLNRLTEGNSQGTRRLRYVQVKAFFNFCIKCLEVEIPNPCDNNLLLKIFRTPKKTKKTVASKETIDELIYRCDNERDRLMIELMARSGLRIGEVLKIRPCDIDGRKITLQTPKSGKDVEYAYMTESTTKRMELYVKVKDIGSDEEIFNLSYSGARYVVNKAGDKVGVVLKPHDLRRHSATYASRMGIPIEVISKVILRHANLSTTQVYLGAVSESDALRYMDTLYEK